MHEMDLSLSSLSGRTQYHHFYHQKDNFQNEMNEKKREENDKRQTTSSLHDKPQSPCVRTHYVWPTIVSTSQQSTCASPSPTPTSTSTSDQSFDNSLIFLRKKKRKGNPIPLENKDDAYWERRKRNNESAKQSREVRRVKEHQTNARVAFLENENVKLKAEVDTLREEIGKLREMLYRPNFRNN